MSICGQEIHKKYTRNNSTRKIESHCLSKRRGMTCAMQIMPHYLYGLLVLSLLFRAQFQMEFLELFVINRRGGSHQEILGALRLGKAMTSRILSSPVSSITRRSMPRAIPPWGGAPYSNDSSIWPNCSLICSS